MASIPFDSIDRFDSMVTRQHDARAHARPRTMDAQLSALAKAQDEFRNAVSVGLGEMRTAYEGVARESASEAKGRASERDAARRAIETSEQAREKLEQKLLQCEEALREAKGALVETREQAKDVRDSDSIHFRCARDRGDDFHDSRVERARFSTARGREDDDVMRARVSPRAGPLEDARADAREDGLECARASRRSARIRAFERAIFIRPEGDSTRLERETDARLAPRRRRVKRTRTN